MRIPIGILLFFINSIIYCQASDLEKEISKIIKYDTEIDHKLIPGFSIGIIDGDSTFYIHYGYATKSSDTKLDQNMVFEIGSSTKVMTSLLFQTLQQEGLLKFDQKVNDLLPAEYINPRLPNLTVWDLINHRSGFSRIPEYFGKYQTNSLNPYSNFKKENLLEYYQNYIPRSKIEFSYSHTNYALLEIIAEYVTTRSFHDLIEGYVFRPLSMKESFLDFPENKKITPGYNRAMRKVKPWTFSSFSGSEGVKSTLNDMCLFIKGHLGSVSGIDSHILDKQLEIQSETSYNDKILMANGWHVVDQGKNYNIFTHTGKTSGHMSFIAFVRETNTGVVILGNSSTGTADLGFLVLRMINYNWKRKSHVR